MKSIEVSLAAWFSAHYGVIDRRGALALGLSAEQVRGRLRRGEWVRVFAGVFRLASTPDGPLPRLAAAVLLGGRGAVVSHRSAAWLWELCDGEPSQPTVIVPRSRVVRAAGIRAVRSRRPPRVVRRKGLPCVDVMRAIVDCAAEVDDDALDDMVDRAIARRHITADRISAALETDAYRQHRGRRRLGRRLAQRGLTGSPHPSVLESRMARLFRKHCLPVPKAEMAWGPHQRYRLDYAYPAIRLAIEVDGVIVHGRPESLRYDHRRNRALALAGWTVLRYDWWEVVYEPDRVAAEIAAMYKKLSAAA